MQILPEHGQTAEIRERGKPDLEDDHLPMVKINSTLELQEGADLNESSCEQLQITHVEEALGAFSTKSVRAWERILRYLVQCCLPSTNIEESAPGPAKSLSDQHVNAIRSDSTNPTIQSPVRGSSHGIVHHQKVINE